MYVIEHLGGFVLVMFLLGFSVDKDGVTRLTSFFAWWSTFTHSLGVNAPHNAFNKEVLLVQKP